MLTRRMLVAGWLTLPALLIGLSGCGGGGTSYPLNPQTRLLMAEDQWTYRGESKSDTTQSFHFTVTLKAATLNDAPVLEEVTTVTGASSSPYRNRLLTQNPATRDVTLVGYRYLDGRTQTLTTPLVVLPGNWSTASVLPGSQEAQEEAITIMGREGVGTPLGTFTAYKTTQATGGNNEFGGGTRWYVPQLGTYVREEYHSFCTVCGVKNYSSTVELETTSIPLNRP